jgi:hypothetical protein
VNEYVFKNGVHDTSADLANGSMSDLLPDGRAQVELDVFGRVVSDPLLDYSACGDFAGTGGSACAQQADGHASDTPVSPDSEALLGAARESGTRRRSRGAGTAVQDEPAADVSTRNAGAA